MIEAAPRPAGSSLQEPGRSHPSPGGSPGRPRRGRPREASHRTTPAPASTSNYDLTQAPTPYGPSRRHQLAPNVMPDETAACASRVGRGAWARERSETSEQQRPLRGSAVGHDPLREGSPRGLSDDPPTLRCGDTNALRASRPGPRESELSVEVTVNTDQRTRSMAECPQERVATPSLTGRFAVGSALS